MDQHGYAVNTPAPPESQGCTGKGCFRIFLGFLSLICLVGGLFILSLGKFLSEDNAKTVASELASTIDFSSEIPDMQNFANEQEISEDMWEMIFSMDEMSEDEFNVIMDQLENSEAFDDLNYFIPEINFEYIQSLSPSNAMIELLDTTIEGFYDMRIGDMIGFLPENAQSTYYQNLDPVSRNKIEYLTLRAVHANFNKIGWTIKIIGFFLLFLVFIMGKKARRFIGPGVVLAIAGLSGLNLILQKAILEALAEKTGSEQVVRIIQDILISIFKSVYLGVIIGGIVLLFIGIVISITGKRSSADFPQGPPPPDAMPRD